MESQNHCFSNFLSGGGAGEGFPGGDNGEESACLCQRHKRRGFNPWLGKICWNRKWQPASVFLPGKFHGQRSLANYTPWNCKKSDTTELLSIHTRTHCLSTIHSKDWQFSSRVQHTPFINLNCGYVSGLFILVHWSIFLSLKNDILSWLL